MLNEARDSAPEDRATATLGIDLAAQPANTAMCRIDWNSDGTGYVHCPGEGATDLDMITMVMDEDIERVGIDAPFGWPVSFIEAVTTYRDAGVWPDALGDDARQKEMRFRATDRAVRVATKLVPLSVSTDRIGVAAMRCARLLAAVQASTGTQIDRTGLGKLVEVYPAAALVRWDSVRSSIQRIPAATKARVMRRALAATACSMGSPRRPMDGSRCPRRR